MKDYCVYIGRLDKLKGIDILLKAWQQMGNKASDLVICGTGPLETWCREYIHEKEMNNVEMKGYIPHEKVGEILNKSKALIMPTQWYEGFPMTLVEAFNAGVPVIGSDIGNVGDLIKPGVTGEKFQVGSVESLRSAVENFQNNEGSYNVYVGATAYSPAENYRELIEIYRKIKDA